MSMGSSTDLAALLAPHVDDIVAFRRDLHAHPETGHREVRTTARIAGRLERAGLIPQFLPGTGVMCDLGRQGPAVLLRADIDALPLPDESGLEFASTNPGVSHACGHDIHTSALLGAGLALADLDRRGRLPGRVRLVFQPAEEVMPGGSLDVIAAGGLDGVESAFALHCDPSADVGLVSLRPGAITSACDHVLVRLQGSGGHTSRPHFTEDLVFALAQVATQVPAILSRRLDPRAGPDERRRRRERHPAHR
jgi:amidohydrolase